MKLLSSSMIFLFLLFSAPPYGAAQPTSKEQIQRELETIINERCAAIKTGDAQKDLSFLAADHMYKFPNGKTVSRLELETLGTAQDNIVIKEFSQTINKLTLSGNVVMLEVAVRQVANQKMKDGRDALVTNEWIENQTWIKNTDGWKLRIAEWKKLKKNTIEGMTPKEYQKISPAPPSQIQPDEKDKPIIEAGNALIFIYRLEDHALPKTSVFCNDTELAELTRGSYIKVKLPPGIYQFRSEKESAIELSVQGGKLYCLEVKLDAGFPAAKGVLTKDEGALGPQFYKLPKSVGLKSLDPKHVQDQSRVILN